MKLPAFTYGKVRQIRPEIQRIITKIKRGASWREATASAMVDTAEVPGAIVICPGARLTGQNFHVYLPMREFLHAALTTGPRLQMNILPMLYASALHEPWGVLALQGWDNHPWLSFDHNWILPFVRATVRYWSEFPDEQRYSLGGCHRDWLWSISPGICLALRRLGIPREALRPTIHTVEELRALLFAYGINIDRLD